ncbi:MAG TPA: hypothetical protein VNO31_05380 [Umezawaea sp.]|nr:hypothetical protein [Umezawaea sp.]
MSALSDYLHEVGRERGISGPRPFARHAGIPIATAQRLLDGRTEPTLGTLETVASMLGLSLAKLKRLAGIKSDLDPFELPEKYAKLGPKQRQVVLTVAAELLRLVEIQEADTTEESSAQMGSVTPIARQRVTEAAWTPESDPHMEQ